MKRIAVFASGFGSNLQALLDCEAGGNLNGKIVLVFSNNAKAHALKRAENHGIKTVAFCLGDFKNRDEFDGQVLNLLEAESIDLVVLAGYMLLIGNKTVSKYRGRILNIHPALLPSFKGIEGIKDAFEYGVKVTGVTVHFVDEDLDSGPIVFQEPVTVKDTDTLEILEEKIHEVEHRIYPLAVKYFCEDRLKIMGRKVSILI